MIYNSAGTKPETSSKGYNVSVSLGSGVVAGVVAAIVSHPADTLLSKINKKGAGGEGSTTTRLLRIARETGTSFSDFCFVFVLIHVNCLCYRFKLYYFTYFTILGFVKLSTTGLGA